MALDPEVSDVYSTQLELLELFLVRLFDFTCEIIGKRFFSFRPVFHDGLESFLLESLK